MIKILDYNAILGAEVIASPRPIEDVSVVVAEILARVRAEGDKALYDYAERFDKVRLASLRVTEEEIEAAIASVDADFVHILETSAANIREYHEKQRRDGFEIRREGGVILGQKVTPIERVGLYVPGGTAAYPSTVLMDAIPAKIAGCDKVVMTTPPGRDGQVPAVILAAALVAGVDEIYKVGGAQAIGALAYGTESVPKVDKIVGPGNAFVAEAKKQVFGLVSIDMIAGPSEILVIADGANDPDCIAADLLSQAEHDRNASAVLITDDAAFAEAVQGAIEGLLEGMERRDIARASIDNNGKIIVVKDLDEGVAVANDIAPEHLELAVADPFAYLGKVRHAGSVFLGRYCPEPIGDYYAGMNHTLPTCGTARFSSALSVDDFVKKTQYAYYPEEALAAVAADVAAFARKEGLTGHAKSATIRSEKK
ncbi:MAG: histidinol dehydrogenase [Clostridia bacterium]|nr:histidinol dehydrogenase [Clostridia bacterium]